MTRVRRTSGTKCWESVKLGKGMEATPPPPYLGSMHWTELTCVTNRKCRNDGVWLPRLGHKKTLRFPSCSLRSHTLRKVKCHVMRTSKQPYGQVHMRPPAKSQHVTEPAPIKTSADCSPRWHLDCTPLGETESGPLRKDVPEFLIHKNDYMRQ